jgi:ubiquinone/menaquinone biosynthesis C-methylase UbiE
VTETSPGLGFLERVSLRRRRALLETVRAWIALGPGTRVLDLGGAGGAVTAEVAAGAAEITVLDPDPSRIAGGRSARPTLRFVEGFAENLPFDPGRFERVLALRSLHHFEDPVRALREVRRVLTDEGLFIVGEIDPASLLARLFRTMHRLSAHGPLRFVTGLELERTISAAGLVPAGRATFRSEYLLRATKIPAVGRPGQ